MRSAIVIIPTFNERENIPKTISALWAEFAKITTWKLGVLIVDDTSPDKTYDVVRELQPQYPGLELLVNAHKSGLGGAYLKGMKHAFEVLHADVIFEFDADLSHDPSKLSALLAKIDDGYDMALGSRYIKGGSIPADWGMHRKFMSVVGNLVILLILGNRSVRDWTTGYRCITKRVFETVSPFMQSERFAGYTFQVGFLYQTLKHGFRVAEVPFHFKDRTIGHSKIGPEYIKNTLLYLMKIRIQELMEMRVVKFAFVGGAGALSQLISLQIFRLLLAPLGTAVWLGFITPFSIATFLAIEIAVALNFTLSNIWTFADRKLSMSQIPLKFLQFNLASAGSILIQLIINTFAERFIGIHQLFVVPLINKPIDTGLFYAVVGIFIGMFWNFFAYNRFVWQKKHKK